MGACQLAASWADRVHLRPPLNGYPLGRILVGPLLRLAWCQLLSDSLGCALRPHTVSSCEKVVTHLSQRGLARHELHHGSPSRQPCSQLPS